MRTSAAGTKKAVRKPETPIKTVIKVNSTKRKKGLASETAASDVGRASRLVVSLDKWKRILVPNNKKAGTFLANLAKHRSELKKHQRDCKVYASLPGSIKHSPALVKELIASKISTRGVYLRHLPDRMRSDRELALMAVRNDGMALQYVKGNPKQDRELVLAAVSGKASALRFAPKKIRSDRDIVKAALKFGLFNNCPLLYADEKFRKDEELVKLACLKRTDDKFFDYIDPALRRRKDIILLAYKVGSNDHALRFAEGEDRDDPEIRAAMKKHYSWDFEHIWLGRK